MPPTCHARHIRLSSGRACLRASGLERLVRPRLIVWKCIGPVILEHFGVKDADELLTSFVGIRVCVTRWWDGIGAKLLLKEPAERARKVAVTVAMPDDSEKYRVGIHLADEVLPCEPFWVSEDTVVPVIKSAVDVVEVALCVQEQPPRPLRVHPSFSKEGRPTPSASRPPLLIEGGENHPVRFASTPPWKGGEKFSPPVMRRGASTGGGVVWMSVTRISDVARREAVSSLRPGRSRYAVAVSACMRAGCGKSARPV